MDGMDVVYVRDAEYNMYTYTVDDIDMCNITIGDTVTVSVTK